MTEPYYQEDGITIYCGDCRDILPQLPMVDLVLTDPPYMGILDEEWDNQWNDDDDFMRWIDAVLVQLDSVTADNATVYMFSSPRLAARVEVMVSRRFRVIASAVWDKGVERNGAAGSGVEVGALRTFWASNTERVVVAEKFINGAYRVADDKAKEASGYWEKCEEAKRSVFGKYLQGEFARAKVTNKQVAALFLSRTGGMTGCVSNWLLGFNVPTSDQYGVMRAFLNRDGDEYLRREYDDLRREYDDLRREYDDLRRPFFLSSTDQWGDVWRFGIERNRQHPAQKPLPLIAQIVRVSSRPGNLVLDPFMGSGTTLVAAKQLGRRAIGIEIEQKYCDIAIERLRQGVLKL
jgi:site-specific DNA-methyltransferase (adenine-specific)